MGNVYESYIFKMQRSKSTARGDNLRKLRERWFKTRRDAVNEMMRRGCLINYRRYTDLEGGSMPSELELRQIPIILKCDPSDWLFAHDPDYVAHCDEFEGLSPKMRQVALEVVRTIKNESDKLGLNEL